MFNTVYFNLSQESKYRAWYLEANIYLHVVLGEYRIRGDDWEPKLLVSRALESLEWVSFKKTRLKESSEKVLMLTLELISSLLSKDTSMIIRFIPILSFFNRLITSCKIKQRNGWLN